MGRVAQRGGFYEGRDNPCRFHCTHLRSCCGSGAEPGDAEAIRGARRLHGSGAIESTRCRPKRGSEGSLLHLPRLYVTQWDEALSLERRVAFKARLAIRPKVSDFD